MLKGPIAKLESLKDTKFLTKSTSVTPLKAKQAQREKKIISVYKPNKSVSKSRVSIKYSTFSPLQPQSCTKKPEIPTNSQQIASIPKRQSESVIRTKNKSHTRVDSIFTISNNLAFSKSRCSLLVKRPNPEFETSEIPSKQQSLIDNQEKKPLPVPKNKVKEHFLRKQFTKNSSSLSLLDFWSNDMIKHASKLMKNDSITGSHPNLTLPNIKKISKIEEDEKNDSNYTWIDKNDFDSCLDKIDKFCNETHDETLKLKDKLKITYLNLRN